MDDFRKLGGLANGNIEQAILDDAYLDTTFHYVHPNADYICPDPWKWCKNLKLKNYRDYISELDIG